MRTREKRYEDYGIPEEDVKKLKSILKHFPDEYADLLKTSSVYACPQGVAEIIEYSILHHKGYDSVSKKMYVPIGIKEFYGYKRKTVSEMYKKMRKLGIWK